MRLVPRLPRFRWPWVCIHIPSAVLYYAAMATLAAALGALAGSHRSVNNMFANIESAADIYVAAAVAFFAAFLWMVCLEWSRFVEHKKVHAGDEAGEAKEICDKFAIIPYFVIPLLWVAAATGIALYATDIAVGRALVGSGSEVYAASVAISVVAFIILDYAIARRVGNAAFFETIEKMVYTKSAELGAGAVKSEVKAKYDRLIASGFSKEEALAIIED